MDPGQMMMSHGPAGRWLHGTLATVLEPVYLYASHGQSMFCLPPGTDQLSIGQGYYGGHTGSRGSWGESKMGADALDPGAM